MFATCSTLCILTSMSRLINIPWYNTMRFWKLYQHVWGDGPKESRRARGVLSPHRVCVLNNPILSVALCLNAHCGIMVYDNVRFSIKSFMAFLPWFDRYCRLNKSNNNYAKDGIKDAGGKNIFVTSFMGCPLT
jgi:hypothetical protein